MILRQLAITGFLLAGCSSTSAAREFPQIPSYAISASEPTRISRSLAPKLVANQGKSGFKLLETGSESFAMRLAAMQAAEKTIDLQYYSIHDDTTSNLLLEAVVKAAQRGVRIRFLIDNVSIDEVAETFSVLDGLKNIEIRVFNPLVTRDDGMVERVLTTVTNLDSIQRRMHNKALIADNQIAIMGGRNLGDEYFEEHTDFAFRDLDILCAGPITANISQSFDRYWNSKESVPIGQLHPPKRSAEEIVAGRKELAEYWQKTMESEQGRKLLTQKTELGKLIKIWAPAELVADEPHKVNQDAEETVSKPFNKLDQLLDKASYEFIMVSPYFVPRDEGVAWLKGLKERGIDVRILTNSLASTDVVAVHTGYAPYRRSLVESGIELYEFKPISEEKPKQRVTATSAPAHASLHAKVYVIDRKHVLIGSFNFDPRSIELNTEIAISIHSPELAEQVMKIFLEATSPKSSYRVVSVSEEGAGINPKLVWQGEEDQQPVEFKRDPKPGFWRNIQYQLMLLLPMEDYL